MKCHAYDCHANALRNTGVLHRLHHIGVAGAGGGRHVGVARARARLGDGAHAGLGDGGGAKFLAVGFFSLRSLSSRPRGPPSMESCTLALLAMLSLQSHPRGLHNPRHASRPRRVQLRAFH
jgi:hypothetical protein